MRHFFCKVRTSRNMPTARVKHMARGFPWASRSDKDSKFTDIELRQCSTHLCAIYEYKGELVICDGYCKRQFHMVSTPSNTIGDCPGVVIPEDQMCDTWLCPDCAQGMAMCFKCHTMGTFDTLVRKCPMTYCIRMYCFSYMPNGVTTCPLHRCLTCKQEHASKMLREVVQCLRCPTSCCRPCLQFIQKRGFAPDQEPYLHTSHGETRWVFYSPDHDIVHPRENLATSHIAWIAQ